ncbi:MAG: hypothetical protein WCK27_03175 [Verrucomicrobiota bacterium]
MNVTLRFSSSQPAISRRPFTCAVSQLFLAAALALPLLGLPSQAETHWNLQAVNANGASAWTPSYPITVVGVLLTDPDEMLDSTPNFQPASAGTMGGEWQIVVQAAWPGDRGGTTCWIGQNYALRRAPGDDSFSYSNEAWLAEVARLNHDPATGHAFHKGDLVSVAANGSLFFGGKRNINEQHHNEPEYDFTISLVATNYGLPAPEVLSLTSLMRTNDNNAATSEDIFDQTRATGGEHWQGARVRLNGLTLLTTNGWNPTNLWGSRLCSVTDGENRFFTLRHPRYSLGSAPTNAFDAIGVFSQESGSFSQGTNGYELFVQEIVPSEASVISIATAPVVTWPGSLANYQLQHTNTVGAPGPWQPATNVPALVNGRWTVIVDPADAHTRFYRLQRVQ